MGVQERCTVTRRDQEKSKDGGSVVSFEVQGAGEPSFELVNLVKLIIV